MSEVAAKSGIKGFLDELTPTLGSESSSYQVRYALKLNQERIDLLPLLGSLISLEFTGNIRCSGCGKAIKKIFHSGVCFVCSQKLARCDLCIVRPERCHFHLGTCREPEWGNQHCMQTHCVYLANSSGIKVGITRLKNIPTRWMDQGAVQALPIFYVSSRRMAGLIEVAIAKHIPDKTNWRMMLKNEVSECDLNSYRDQLFPLIQDELAEISAMGIGTFEFLNDTSENTRPKNYRFEYPALEYPTKINSLSFDKTPLIQGKLMGIKGQYLILDSGVLNLGKFEGYEIEVLQI
jgi:hypothetical protein